MIIYTCPECGTDLIEAVATSNPPQRQFVCPSCGWQHWHEDKEEIIRIPYGGNQYKAYDFSDACEYCPNDPRNGGPGNCNCILGAPKIIC
jgi:DNA-directed RNA polymerase subunit RPC12/RpoP